MGEMRLLPSSPDNNAYVERDAAELLYRQSLGGIAVSLAASSFLTYMVLAQRPQRHVIAWWLVMVGALGVRSLDVWAARRRRSVASWSGQAEMRRFGWGALLTATVWVAFPVLFFPSLDQMGRTAMAIILSAMAGGSATVLAASMSISIGYCASMLLPASFMFLCAGGTENKILGGLGIVFFAVMALSARISHGSTMTAIRLNRTNQGLLIEVEGQRNLAEQTNLELKDAQHALVQANVSLESRIRARTADLEREIAERRHYAEELARLASTDPLTGLHNRAKLSEHLPDKLAQAEKSGTKMAVLFIDLDKFKEVNDVKGHDAGDKVLQMVAKRLSISVPAGAALARWGGDEFVVVQDALSGSDEALALAEGIRESVGKPIPIGLETVLIDATVGISLFPDHGRSPDDLIRAADVAMYAGKEDKRGRVRIFDPRLSDVLAKRHQLEQALRETIATDSLSLVFQPIVQATSKQCKAFEALLRWNHPTRGPIAPAEFIPIAERSRQIVPIGSWVLREACRVAASWTGNPPPAVSVNVSPAQFLSEDLAAEVFAALAESGLSPHRLHLEITESLFAGEQASIVSTLRRLREAGIRISLDDFGTGFSCLGYLCDLPIDTLKIDQSFVRTIGSGSHAVLTAIVSISQAMDYKVVAEGVETPAQAAVLRSIGVDYLQGFLYSKPLPASKVAEWLTERERAFSSDLVALSEHLASLRATQSGRLEPLGQ